MSLRTRRVSGIYGIKDEYTTSGRAQFQNEENVLLTKYYDGDQMIGEKKDAYKVLVAESERKRTL